MGIRKLGYLSIESILALSVVLFFASYGLHSSHLGQPYHPPSVLRAIRVSAHFLVNTLTGKNILAQFYGISLQEIWFSIRLILFSTAVSMGLGTAVSILRVRMRIKVLSIFMDTALAVLEAIPEAMYIILMVIVVMVCVLRYQVVLPVFPEGPPTTIDTIVPGIALGLPGALYLQKVLYLRFRDEVRALYVDTAKMKGASQRRIFYLHVFPNVLPTLFRQIGIVAGCVLSSTLFAEFFTDYQGALFYFGTAVGWNMNTGFAEYQKMAGIPIYQVGYTFVLGGLLVAMWMFFQLIGQGIAGMKYPNGVEVVATPNQRKIQPHWSIVGVLFLLVLTLLTIDPHLVTPHSPTFRMLVDSTKGQSAPFPPGGSYPLGSDPAGRDMAAIVLASTWNTLLPAAIITLVVLLGSVGIAVLATVTSTTTLGRLISIVSNVLSAVPVIYILFLALYNRNLQSPYQAVQFMLWIAILEIGRGSAVFRESIQEWHQFAFMEGVRSIGRTRFGALMTHLRSWFGQFFLEFLFSEFSRVMSIMTVLAAFHIYIVETLGYGAFMTSYPPKLGIVSAQLNWYAMIGDITNNMGYTSYPYLLYAPVLALLITMVGANLIARGLRGQ